MPSQFRAETRGLLFVELKADEATEEHAIAGLSRVLIKYSSAVVSRLLEKKQVYLTVKRRRSGWQDWTAQISFVMPVIAMSEFRWGGSGLTGQRAVSS